MVRILILIILAWILYQIIKRLLASINSRATGKPEQKPAQTPEQTPEQKIVQCTHCGCHVLMSESQIKNNKIICNNPECQTITDEKDQHGD